MLNHVERRRILEQPAGKDLAPGQRAVGIGPFLDKDLHEGPGLGRALPRQGPLAGGEPDDDIADPPRLAGLQHDVLGDIVALVEQAERGDALRHRGRAIGGGIGRSGGGGGRRGAIERDALRLGLAPEVAGREGRSAQQQRGKAGEPHRASQPSVLPGVHAS